MFYQQYQLIGNQPTIVVTPVTPPVRQAVHPDHKGYFIHTNPNVIDPPAKRINPFSIVRNLPSEKESHV